MSLIDPNLPWEEDDLAWYVVACHPEGLTLEQVGELFGVTRERIRQIETQALMRLRKHPQSRDVLLSMLRKDPPTELPVPHRFKETL